MLNKLKKSNGEGFTIIEVMIVLAIAGLILLIVFLAVPALQRSSRNTARKSEAGRVVSAFNNYISNNNGQLPKSTGAVGGVLGEAGTLSQFSRVTAGSYAAGSCTFTDATLAACTATANGNVPVAAANVDGILIVEGGQCGAQTAAVGGASPVPAGYSYTASASTSRSAAVFFTTESGSGPSVGCLST